MTYLSRLPLAAVLAAALATAGCANRPDRGAFIGSTAGAVVGNRAFNNSPIATVAGAAVGAAIGADASNNRTAARQAAAQPVPAQQETETR